MDTQNTVINIEDVPSTTVCIVFKILCLIKLFVAIVFKILCLIKLFVARPSEQGRPGRPTFRRRFLVVVRCFVHDM